MIKITENMRKILFFLVCCLCEYELFLCVSAQRRFYFLAHKILVNKEIR